MKSSKLFLTSLLAAAAMSATAFGVTPTTTTLDDVTYSGTIWTTDVSVVASGKQAAPADGHNLSADTRTYTDGTNTYVGKTSISGVGNFYKYFFIASETEYVGNTLRLTGSTADHRINTDWDNYVWLGGLITDASSYTYTIGRDPASTVSNFKLKGAAGVNMLINANTVIWGKGIEVLSSGTAENPLTNNAWNVVANKTLTLKADTTTFEANTATTIGGSGTVKFMGATTTLSNVAVNGSLSVASGATLDLSASKITLGSAIANSGTVTISANTVFNLTTAGSAVTLISGGGTISGVAWNALGLSNFTYNGETLGGRSSVDVATTDGAVTLTYGAKKTLTWNGDASGAGTWELATIGTEPANKPWKDGETDEAFYSGDSVIFDKNATVTVASGGVTAGAVNVTAGTVSFTGSAITAVGGVFVAGTSAESIATLKLTAAGNFAAGTVITVGAHGVFDINAKAETTGFSLVLDGGRLTNTGTGLSGGAKNLSQGLTLTADSYIGGSNKDIYFIGNGGTADVNINLGGYTLTKDGTGTLAMCTGVITNGTLKVTNGTLKSSTGDISGKTIKLGEGGRIEVVENGVMNATIASMAAGSSLTLAGTGASTVTVTGTIETATLNIQNGSLTWTHDGTNRSSAASITIGSGSTFKDDANFKYTLTLSGKLSGAGRLVSGVAYDDSQGSGQGDDYRNVTLEGSTGEFTGEWQLETAGSKHPAGNRRINGILSSSDGKFGGVINFTSTSTESLPVSESKISSKLSLAKNMEIGGLKGTLSNTIVGSNNADSRALTINTVADANYDYAGTIASTISGITKTGSGTQILSGDNSAYTGTTRIEGGKLVAASANALGSGPVTVAADAKLGLVAGTPVTVSGGVELARGAKIVVDMTSVVAGTEDDIVLTLVSETALNYNETGSFDTTGMLGSVVVLENLSETLSAWTQSLSYADSTLKLTLTIPEPSVFGLLAGLGALALAGTRRRRKA